MIRRQYIREFEEGAVMTPDGSYYFFVRHATVKTGRNGKKYIDCNLSDGEKEVNGKVWTVDAEKESVISDGNVIQVLNGRVSSYNNAMQIVIEDAAPVPPDRIDTCCRGIIPDSYAAETDLTERWQALKEKLDDTCTAVVDAFEGHEKIWRKFRDIPAGKSMHLAYRHGLFEHSIHVAELCDLLVTKYEKVYSIWRSKVLLCAMIHDVGKIFEFEINPSSSLVSRYSDRGRLLGHIYMGTTFIEKIINDITDDESFKMEMLHMLLSHHGEYEFGSPKIPKTVEAMILSFADKIDANLDAVNGAMNDSDDQWTKNIFSLGRKFFRTHDNK